MRNTELMVGAFYNPHLGRELAVATGIDHLAMADPPAASDPWWPAISERYTLLLHDYLGQLSEPLDERSIQRARALAELYRSPWVAEHFQCLHTEDGSYNLNYVFPPLYTEEFLDRFVRNACALKARLDQPLVMENIPGFFDVKASQMPEPIWLRRFFEATGAGFLLDLPHVWLQAHYHHMPAERWLDEFPLEHVLEQTMGAVVRDSCVILPPYLRAKGHVVVSKGGGRFGRHGRLGLSFDSLEIRPGRWAAVSAMLDTLEYAPRGGLADSGLVSSGKTSIVGVGKKLVPAGVAAAADLDAVPVALLGGFSLIRRGPPVRILAGEIGGIRLTG